MATLDNLAKRSDSLMDLLGAQCSDLEKLLSLAREETLAAHEGRFTRIWDIVSERTAIGKRLETFQHQIAELRGHLESIGDSVSQHDVTKKIVEMSNLTLLQDQQTRKLLTASRDQTVKDLKTLGHAAARTNSYLREQTKGLAYDSSF